MREMLRIKRSVQAMYNTQVNMMSAQMLSSASAMAGKVKSYRGVRIKFVVDLSKEMKFIVLK